MNKKVLISLAGAALISTGLATIAVEGGNTVDAAKTSLVKGKTKKLARNAYVYNSKGKRVKKRSLKKGKKIKILGFKTIKGKKYVQIGKNEYVVVANFTAKKTSSSVVDPASYKNESEYKKYMSWVNGNGYIVAKKHTEGFITSNSFKGDPDKLPGKYDQPVGMDKGLHLEQPINVYKGSKGNYYIKDRDSAEDTVFYLAKDFEFKPANYETSTSKLDLKNDSELKKRNDAFKKIKNDDEGDAYLVVNKKTQVYKNVSNRSETPDLKLKVADNVNKDTLIQASGYDDLQVIKYNGEFYYAFYYGETYEVPDETGNKTVRYIKASDTVLASESSLEDEFSNSLDHPYNILED